MLQVNDDLGTRTAEFQALDGASSELANKLELERIQCAGIRAMMDELRDDLEAQTLTTTDAQARCTCLSDQARRCWLYSLEDAFYAQPMSIITQVSKARLCCMIIISQ